MEMEYRDPSGKNRWIIILGVVFAVVAGAGSYLVLTKAQQTAAQPVVGQVVTGVVAARQITARKALVPDDLALRKDIPADSTNTSANLLITSTDSLVGVLLSVDVAPGQLITKNLLASDVAGGQFSILSAGETVGPDSEAWRAVAITVTDDRAVGGMLDAGMTVDVIMTIMVNAPAAASADASGAPAGTPATLYGDYSTKVTYQDMRILARQGTSYILKASLRVAEEISHLQASGTAQFSMILRPAVDERVVDLSTLGETTNRIIQRYGLLLPEVYPQPGQVPNEPPIAPLTPPPIVVPSPSPSPSASASS